MIFDIGVVFFCFLYLFSFFGLFGSGFVLVVCGCVVQLFFFFVDFVLVCLVGFCFLLIDVVVGFFWRVVCCCCL